ncbi:response regulator transcription factor [Sulfurovum sp. zt1-1]|uniref:Response regulator transcription factor n=1 Tax=Sulfurovum zhangzhouensis TaxID=3019067 RepID=A0ABT7QYQ4_9BACT|nr:response regulator transcription factor [Sulfurovum zhangzhouensis]MDM5271980.1 response regulator transcription factor [Sulfurovum zhangzhouensis]
MRLLLLEDDHILSETLQYFLSKENYTVDTALSIEEAEELTFANSYDLYLFDINFPQGNGLSLLESLRKAEDTTPTIFITALHDMDSIAQGFKLGAIDYIKKPFDPQELLIRIAAKFTQDFIAYKNLEYDSNSRIIRLDGEIIDLGNVQLKIFEKLIRNCGSVITKEELYECLEHTSDTALRVAITKIKQKLNIDIKNIRSKGYILEKL